LSGGHWLNIDGYDGISINTGAASFGSKPNTMTISSSGSVFVNSSSFLGFDSRAGFSSSLDGIIRLRNNTNTDFNLLQFGGETASFPALKRVNEKLQVRLANDSAFSTLQARIMLDNSAVPESVSATHTLSIYDSTGTEYRILCAEVSETFF
jgi:hypothetical protein